VKHFLPLAAIAILAACGTQQADETAPAVVATPTADATPTMTPPRREEFTAAWAEACPDAEPVGKALCKSKGLTDPNFTCDFALGDGEYRRHNAELAPQDGKWVLADPANACEVE
jgi:hypothetical protein